ncbi:MAG TPA: archaeosortase/exosortase family protein [Gammaproteobacteria bacterium]
MNTANWSNQSLLRLVAVFAGVFFALQWGYQQASGTVIEKAIIDVATVRPSAFMINQINPMEQVIAEGHRLVSPFAKLSVLNGCEGTESLFLIMAAILAFRAPWRHKLAGLALGVILIYLANQARIVSLYFALKSDPALFSALHGYVAPTLIIAVGCVYYLWWMQWPQRNTAEQSASPRA